MIRHDARHERLMARLRRRQLLRLGFVANVLLILGAMGGFFTGLGAIIPGFFRPLRFPGLGEVVEVGALQEIKDKLAATNDEPILVQRGKFFLIHAPDGLLAVYRRCTHLGCTVPWVPSEDQFHCPCHGSLFNKNTGVVQGGPAPRPLDLFPITVQGDVVFVDTHPTEGNMISRSGYDPSQATPL